MNIETFVICDAATETMGKLNILGAFDTLYTKSLPAIHPMCTVVIRIRGTIKDTGQHKITLIGVDDSGNPLIPKFENNFEFPNPEDDPTSTVNFLFNFQSLKISKYGEYKIKLRIDEQLSSYIPLYIKPTPNTFIPSSQV